MSLTENRLSLSLVLGATAPYVGLQSDLERPRVKSKLSPCITRGRGSSIVLDTLPEKKKFSQLK